ncbi:MAG TPA: PD-(D/E)XK nuclease family protein, partial [Actinomycetota bacterium]
TVCCRAARRLGEGDRSFGRFWKALDPFDRAEILADVGRHLFLFRESFPPLPRRWAPQPELALRVHLAGGAVVLSGAPDLVIGRTRRLVLDFKTGRAWPDHPQDMRFYALLVLLRTGVPPYRVATFFLDSGEWQPEDATEEMMDRAADRVAASAAAAHQLLQGREPTLSPGVHCGWCPRRAACPAAAGGFDGPRAGGSSVPHELLPNGRLAYGSDIPEAPTAGPARAGSVPQTEEGATARRFSDGAGRVRSRTDPPGGRSPPADVRPGHPAGTLR